MRTVGEIFEATIYGAGLAVAGLCAFGLGYGLMGATAQPPPDNDYFVNAARICQAAQPHVRCGNNQVPGVEFDLDPTRGIATVPATIRGFDTAGKYHAVVGTCELSCIPKDWIDKRK